MYFRETNSGNTVEWNPENETLAKQAMEETPGTGVPDHVTLPDSAPVKVSEDVARKVRERYQELLNQ